MPGSTELLALSPPSTLASGTCLIARYPSAKLIQRDLAAEQLPHLDGTTLRAIATKDLAEAETLRPQPVCRTG